MKERKGLRGHRVQNPARAEARRRGVLLAAAQAFAARGYVATTMDDIAERMGTTKGVLYYYFRRKEEIFTEIRTTAIRDAIERLDAILARGEPPTPTLHAALTDLVSHIFGRLDQYANVLEEPHALSPASREKTRALQREYERRIMGILEDGIRTGEFVDGHPKVMAFTLLRTVLSVAFWYDPAGYLEPEYIIREVTTQALSGVTARPSDGAMAPGMPQLQNRDGGQE